MKKMFKHYKYNEKAWSRMCLTMKGEICSELTKKKNSAKNVLNNFPGPVQSRLLKN